MPNRWGRVHMFQIARRSLIFCVSTVLAVVISGLALAGPAFAVTMTPDYGVVLDDGFGSWNVVANDGDPNTSGTDYVEVTSGPDTVCDWICSDETSISVDASSAPGAIVGTTITIGYRIVDG